MISKIVVGAGFGDEGKGTMVDYLAGQMKADVVVRFNGGAQTAHNVIHDGVHHTFSQWGSATLRGIPTYLGPYVLVDPEMALREAEALSGKIPWNPWDLLRVSMNAVIVTPWHRMWNKHVEDGRGCKAHGSCGMGIGAAREMELGGRPTLRIKDLWTSDLRNILVDIRECYATLLRYMPSVDEVLETMKEYASRLQRGVDPWGRMDKVVFEGAQGILLDETWGTAPHNTWTDCTPRRALDMVPLGSVYDAEVVLVTRTYMTRHGHGPFASEYPPGRPDKRIPEKHNQWGQFQGAFRQGFLDFQALRYSLAIARAASTVKTKKVRNFNFALTHWDVAGKDLKWVDYAGEGWIPTNFKEMEELFFDRLGESIRYVSNGPSSADKNTLW